jgi:hypothetical protein
VAPGTEWDMSIVLTLGGTRRFLCGVALTDVK